MTKRIDKSQPDKEKGTDRETEIDALEKTNATETMETMDTMDTMETPSFTFTPLESTMEETNEGDAPLSEVYDVEVNADTESDSITDLDEEDTSDSVNEPEEQPIVPTLLYDAPVTRPDRSTMTRADLDAERAVVGKRPSMREPRKGRSGGENGQSDSYLKSDVGLNEQLRRNELQYRNIREMELAERLKRDERKEAEIVIPEGTFDLKEDIQIMLSMDAIKSILIQALNNKYKKEGLQVNTEIDDALVLKQNSHVVFAEAKLCRIPVIQREFIDG